MEEAKLIKERLQAITNKRKIQEDIALKRLEIDKEKLKLQQLKKTSTRDLWLMGGTSAEATKRAQKAQDITQQTKTLQNKIYWIEKEIETLEREELNISTNEGLILNRLKAIEKSTEDIIKEANENFKSEPFHGCSGNPDTRNEYTPLNVRKHQTVVQGNKCDQQTPALFAMEINVQKDLHTGESHVLSTSAIPVQELRKRGIKVYDDGRKCVYALHASLEQPEANGVDELSPVEVEELLKKAKEKWKKPQEQHEPPCLTNYLNSHCSDMYNMDEGEWPELEYSQGLVHYPYQEIHEPSRMFRHYSDQHEYYCSSNDNGYEIYGGETRSDPEQSYDPRERHRKSQSQNVDSVVNHIPPLSYRDNSKPSILNTLPSEEPVTMIFMGYHRAEEAAQNNEGSIQAKLVVIGDGEEDAITCATPFQRNHIRSLQTCNTNTTSTHLTSETSSSASLHSQTV